MEAVMTTFETFSATHPSTRARTVAALFAAVVAPAVARYRVWKNRRSVARLLAWDERMLSDIGLTQGDVYSAMATAPADDPSVQLSMLSLERRFAREAQFRDRLSRAAELRARGRRSHLD
jgi:uncharacterized protein YjiS (DUF1127 family)